jgi:radical SAM protein (TIGR01212 family)
MPPSAGTSPINLYSAYLKRQFGSRVQKISIHPGLSCPNRNHGRGCRYCSPESFLPPNADASVDPLLQFEGGISRFRSKYPDQFYLAYIQGYTGTLAPVKRLAEWYRRLLDHPMCSGLVVGTRPDCLPEEVMGLFADLKARFPGKLLRIELGVESFDRRVLELADRRCTPEQSVAAIETVAAAGIPADVHLILGLPGAAEDEHPETMLNVLPVSMVKFHQFQIVRGSPWADAAAQASELFGKVTAEGLRRASVMTVESYADTVIGILTRLSPDIMVGRLAADAPESMVSAHKSWNAMKNYRFTAIVEAEMKRRGLHQGALIP